MGEMTIGKLAREAGVGVETVRYYQRRGLLALPRRPAIGIRRYPVSTLTQLRFIRRAQEVGFALDEIKALLELGERPQCRGARSLAVRKLVEVEARIGDLERMRSSLASMIRQCDEGIAVRCAIIETLSRE